MHTGFDALSVSQPARQPAGEAATPPAQQQQWQTTWQQARQQAQPIGPETPGDAPRVAWRDASATSTWLAPVRPREPAWAAPLVLEPASAAPDIGGGLAAAPDDAPLRPQRSPRADAIALPSGPGLEAFMPALPMALHDGVAPGALPPAATAQAPGGVVSGQPAPRVPAPPAAAATPAGLPLRGIAAALPRLAPAAPVRPAAPPPTQDFTATHLQLTSQDDGLAVWLRDATLAHEPAHASRVLQALAAMGLPRDARPNSVYLNGRLLWSAATPEPRPSPPSPHQKELHGD